MKSGLCSLCGKYFKYLKTHFMYKHTKEGISCEKCEKLFKSKGPSQIKKQTKRWYMYQKRGGGSGTQNVPSFFFLPKPKVIRTL